VRAAETGHHQILFRTETQPRSMRSNSLTMKGTPMSTDAATLMDRTKIAETICRWAFCIDLKDWDGFGEQFTDPVEIAVANVDWDSEVPPRMLTRAQWVNTVRTSLRYYSSFQHMITPYQIDVNGSEAYAVSYVNAPHVIRRETGGNLMLSMGGYYKEYLTKSGGAWKISRHKLHLLWTHGDPEALALIAKENTADELK
jgi:hypothetical protein